MIEYYKNLSLENLFYIDENGIVQEEEWRDVLGYENHYKVSNLGRIKTLKFNKERIMKIQKNLDGYDSICLTLKGNVKTFTVHLLIGKAFLDYDSYDSDKYDIDHKNNNKNINTIYNLQVITSRKNSSKDKKNKTSKYTGVSWYPQTNKWQAGIYYIDRRIHLGYFDSEKDANESYKLALYAIENGLEIQKANNNFSSKYKGVAFHKKANKWRAFTIINKKQKHLGLYICELDAKKAVEDFLKEKTIY